MMVRKTIRVWAVSFAVLALLVFSTTVVSDWDCHNAADDTRCPYCHLTHQAPAPESDIPQNVSFLSLLLPRHWRKMLVQLRLLFYLRLLHALPQPYNKKISA